MSVSQGLLPCDMSVSEISAGRKRLFNHEDTSAALQPARSADVRNWSDPLAGEPPNQYRYMRLGRGEVRLIEIHKTHPRLVAHIFHASISRAPEYYAISYAWGNHEATEHIDCGSGTLAVSPHLYRGLQSVGQVSGKTTFFADAICINQDDEIEKAQQVLSMFDIFGSAAAVFAWLGDGIEGEEMISFASKPEVLLDWKVPVWKDFGARFHEENPHRIVSMLFDKALRLAERLWFNRLWVYQEVVAAKRVELILGNIRLDRDEFLALLNYLIEKMGRSRWHSEFFLRGDKLSRLTRSFRAMKVSQESDHSYGRLFGAVMAGRELGVSLEVDRVFGLISLANEHDGDYVDALRVDYSDRGLRNYKDLYLEFCRTALRSEAHLRLLSYAGDADGTSGLPSWCIDLRRPMDTTELFSGPSTSGVMCPVGSITACRGVHPLLDPYSSFDSRLVSRAPGTFLIPGLDESGMYNQTPALLDSSDRLHVAGAKVGVAVECGTAQFPTSESAELEPWLTAVFEWCIEGVAAYETVRKAEGAQEELDVFRPDILGTVTNDQGTEQYPRHSQRDSDMNALLEQLYQGRSVNVIMGMSTVATTRRYRDLLRLVFQSQKQWVGRTWIVVKDVNNQPHLAFASHRSQPGDVVCMLYAGRPLYVLRPISGIDGRHRLVGDTYATGLMGPQVFEMMHEGAATEEVFCIV